MQVSIRVSRDIGGVTMVFEAVATSVAEAIQVANQLQECKAAELPAASTDKEVIEKHTGAADANKEVKVDDAAVAKAKADADKKAKAEAVAKAKADAAKKAADAAVASQSNSAADETKPDVAGEKTLAEHVQEAKDAPEYDYNKDIRPLILDMSKNKGREPTVAALARFGAKSGAELKPEQYPVAFQYFTDVISGKIDPLKAEADDEALA